MSYIFLDLLGGRVVDIEFDFFGTSVIPPCQPPLSVLPWPKTV